MITTKVEEEEEDEEDEEYPELTTPFRSLNSYTPNPQWVYRSHTPTTSTTTSTSTHNSSHTSHTSDLHTSFPYPPTPRVDSSALRTPASIASLLN